MENFSDRKIMIVENVWWRCVVQNIMNEKPANEHEWNEKCF